MAKTLRKKSRNLRKSRNKQFNKNSVRKNRSKKKHVSRIKRHKFKKRFSRKMTGGGDTLDKLINIPAGELSQDSIDQQNQAKREMDEYFKAVVANYLRKKKFNENNPTSQVPLPVLPKVPKGYELSSFEFSHLLETA